MQNANRSDCEKANKQTSTQKEQQWKLEKENSNETSIIPPPLSPTVFQQYSHIRHLCSCNMTVAHPRDLLRCMRRKTPDFKGIPQGWIYNVKIIYWMAPTDISLLSFECDVVPHTCCFRLNNRPNCYVRLLWLMKLLDILCFCVQFLISIMHLSIFKSRNSWKAAYYFKSHSRRDVLMSAI